MTTIREMRAEDVAAVMDIQSRCHDVTKLESHRSFLAKLSASPATCFIALVTDVPAGYLVAVPIRAGNPPPLNSPYYSVPPAANALYLHDLAVHPAARGTGIAELLIETYFATLKLLEHEFACLTAVNESGPFWERYGFRAEMPGGLTAENMATYGAGARYMSLQLDD